MDLVSIVIPCFDPTASLLEAIASARAQLHGNVEVILVDDGSADPESKAILRRAAQEVDRYIEQANRGVSAARNAAIRAASGALFVPLDCEDILKPDFVSACFSVLETRPETAFVYTDYRVFGKQNYTERLRDYNLYDLLENNTLPYASLIRTEDWSAIGGYDESFIGYEDWEFWLRLGASGRFGHHLDRVLWSYRKQGPSLSDIARDRHDELVARIRSKHPTLYSSSAYARIKTRWKPSVCVVGKRPGAEQTICDWEVVDATDSSRELLAASGADTFLFPNNALLDPQILELSAVAVLGKRDPVLLPDGSTAVPRSALAARGNIASLTAPVDSGRRLQSPRLQQYPPRFLETIWRHLSNAELLRTDSWLEHPIRSLSRLIPLRLKEEVNRRIGRPVFDLTFYLRFQPRSLVLGETLVAPVRYIARPPGPRRRLVLVTPHLGVGGAEAVLLDVASALDRRKYEILLIATNSLDSRWLSQWRDRVDHIFDLHGLVSPEHLGAALISIVSNWQCDTLLVQNALQCYDILPHLKKALPGIKILDIVHGDGEDWSVLSCTAAVAEHLDRRIVVSERDRVQLVRSGVGEEAICFIRNGVDLGRFTCQPQHAPQQPHSILFAARLDPVKRPLLLPRIARALLSRRQKADFRFVVAGDGSEEAALRSAVRRSRLDHLFEFRGHVADLAPVLADSALLVITSRSEGTPLVLLESFASGKPVVASNVGAIAEVLDEETGFLIEPGDQETEAFAIAIDALLSDSQLRLRMGMAGRQKVEADYSKCRSLQAYRELFESLSLEPVSAISAEDLSHTARAQ